GGGLLPPQRLPAGPEHAGDGRRRAGGEAARAAELAAPAAGGGDRDERRGEPPAYRRRGLSPAPGEARQPAEAPGVGRCPVSRGGGLREGGRAGLDESVKRAGNVSARAGGFSSGRPDGSRLQHDLDAAVLLVAELLVHLGRLLQRRLVRDDERRV